MSISSLHHQSSVQADDSTHIIFSTHFDMYSTQPLQMALYWDCQSPTPSPLFHSAVLLHGSFANLLTLNIASATPAYVALQVKSDNETKYHQIFVKRSEMWEEVQWFRARLCRLDIGKSSQYLDFKPWSPKLAGANNRLLFICFVCAWRGK